MASSLLDVCLAAENYDPTLGVLVFGKGGQLLLFKLQRTGRFTNFKLILKQRFDACVNNKA
jgi:hypothetical protein